MYASGYLFTPPKTPLVRDRPGYGGTCYSDFTVSSTVKVLQYDESGSTVVVPWAASTSPAQAFAHPIDGFAPNAPKVGCASNLTSAASGISSGAIAGIVVGSFIGLLAILGLVLFFLRRRRAKKAAMETQQQEIQELEDDHSARRPDLGVATKYGYFDEARELGGSGVSELNAEPVHELPATPKATWPNDTKYISRDER